MSMYSQFKTDTKMETNGIVIDYGDFRVTIARAGGANKKYAKLLETKTQPYRRAIQTETMDNELAIDVLRQVYSEAVVLNWETKCDDKFKKGIEAPNGGDLLAAKPVNIVATFKALPDLFSDIQAQANKVALFREQVLEEDAGN